MTDKGINNSDIIGELREQTAKGMDSQEEKNIEWIKSILEITDEEQRNQAIMDYIEREKSNPDMLAPKLTHLFHEMMKKKLFYSLNNDLFLKSYGIITREKDGEIDERCIRFRNQYGYTYLFHGLNNEAIELIRKKYCKIFGIKDPNSIRGRKYGAGDLIRNAESFSKDIPFEHIVTTFFNNGGNLGRIEEQELQTVIKGIIRAGHIEVLRKLAENFGGLNYINRLYDEVQKEDPDKNRWEQ